MWRTQEKAYLVEQDGTERPALEWLRTYLQDYLASVQQPYTLVPQAFYLSNNYPNPFNPRTLINYSIPQRCHVSLKVYNLLGQEVASLFNGIRQAGDYVAAFDGSNLAAGMYVYRLEADNFRNSKRLLLIK